jgi:CDGSH-type Zn-finger protein
MARIVRITRDGPYKIEPADLSPIWICGCGLSQTMPLCDKSHKKCRDELPDSLYIYEGDSRREVRQAEQDE